MPARLGSLEPGEEFGLPRALREKGVKVVALGEVGEPREGAEMAPGIGRKHEEEGVDGPPVEGVEVHGLAEIEEGDALGLEGEG